MLLVSQVLLLRCVMRLLSSDARVAAMLLGSQVLLLLCRMTCRWHHRRKRQTLQRLRPTKALRKSRLEDCVARCTHDTLTNGMSIDHRHPRPLERALSSAEPPDTGFLTALPWDFAPKLEVMNIVSGTDARLLLMALTLLFTLPIALSTTGSPPRYSRDAMPNTSFSCDDKASGGYYADTQAECQMFHVCVRVSEEEVSDETRSYLNTRSI
ncbi:hypothetical protein HAZT_HAZT008180 [Hyalella azteca]|uniref:Uncharacterized protein n=1 Tax=Hyalella azteca TaxID=294128 RepID=A0A6A0GSF7_HYAAZ|nr:hypothetical protein HAZT_HAZT008180 [Hyalella azteca]